MRRLQDDLDFSLFAFSLISTNVRGDLLWQNPLLCYISKWCNKCDTTVTIWYEKKLNFSSGEQVGILCGAAVFPLPLPHFVPPSWCSLQPFAIVTLVRFTALKSTGFFEWIIKKFSVHQRVVLCVVWAGGLICFHLSCRWCLQGKPGN